jgi:hypothetical protein
MRVRYSVLLVIVAVALFRAPAASAQSLGSAAVEASIGTAEGRGGEFVDRSFAAAHIAASGVVPITPDVGFFLALGYDWFGFFAAPRGDICRVNPASPGSGCLPSFPTIGGSNLVLGTTVALGTTVELRAGIGGGAYSLNGTRIGGTLAEGDAALYPLPYLGIVVNARTIALPRYRQDRLSLTHFLLGVRLRMPRSRPVKPNER